MDEPEPIVDAHGLTKRFGTFVAVDGIDFAIQRGTCVGFLGPNGAGKTTTAKMIYCVSPVSAGTLTVRGMDVMEQPRAIKRLIGVAPQENNLDPDFTIYENLLVFSRYFGMDREYAAERADELLSFLALDMKRDDTVESLSGGLKRRLVIARALLNEPEILVLDEPTTGLDPQARIMIWDRLHQLKRRGITIILTTHYMEEAMELCDRVLIMDEGRVVVEGAPHALVERYNASDEVLVVGGTKEMLDAVHAAVCGDGHHETLHCEVLGNRLQIFCDDPRALETELMERFELTTRTIRPTNLEDVFLTLTGRRL